MEYVLVLVGVIAAFYFILLRPVLNQQRQQRRDISSLEIGDEVLTTGGFYAVVNQIDTFEDRPMEILLEAAPGVQLRGTTAAIAAITRRRLHDEEPDPDEVEDDDDDWDDDDEDEEDDLDEEDEDDDWDDDEDEDDLDDEELDDEDLEDEDDDWDEDDDEDDEDEDDEEEDEPVITKKAPGRRRS